MTDTLKSICEQCAHLHNPQLDLVLSGAQHQREIIQRDLKELIFAASHEQEKTVVILAGMLFESILYCFTQSQIDLIEARRGEPFIFKPQFSLNNYVSIFNRYFSTGLTIPDFVVDYRDIVHINQELALPPDVCRSAAPQMLKLLDALLGYLTAIVGC